MRRLRLANDWQQERRATCCEWTEPAAQEKRIETGLALSAKPRARVTTCGKHLGWPHLIA